jgi:hypothetical protein
MLSSPVPIAMLVTRSRITGWLAYGVRAGACGFGCLVAADPFGGEDWQSSSGHGQVEDRSQRQWRGEPDDLGARRSNRLRLAAVWSVIDVVVLTATTSRRMASSSQ